MPSFIALYRGDTIGSAKLVGVSAAPPLVQAVTAQLLRESPQSGSDPVLDEQARGRRRALRLIAREVGTDAKR